MPAKSVTASRERNSSTSARTLVPGGKRTATDCSGLPLPILRSVWYGTRRVLAGSRCTKGLITTLVSSRPCFSRFSSSAISCTAWPPVTAKSAGVRISSSRSLRSFIRLESMTPMTVNRSPKTLTRTSPTSARSIPRWPTMSVGRIQTLSSPGSNQRPATSARSSPVTPVSSGVRPSTPSALWALSPCLILMWALDMLLYQLRGATPARSPKLLWAYSRTESSIGFQALLRIRIPS